MLEAVVAGRVSEDQARVIVAALDALPDHLDVGLRAKAEAHLDRRGGSLRAEAAASPRAARFLTSLLRTPLTTSSEGSSRRRKRRARKRTSLIMRTRGDGVTDISIRVPDFVGARLKVYLEAFTSPRRDGKIDLATRDPATGEQRRDIAAAGSGVLRTAGRHCRPMCCLSTVALRPSIVISLDYDQLRTGAGAANQSTGDVIAAGARYVAWPAPRA